MKTVIAKFTGDNYANVYDVYQWNYGQALRIEGLKLPKMVEVHFSLEETGGKAVPRIGTTKDGATDVIIPDSMLENEGATGTYKIYAWVYLTDADSGSTEYKVTIHVKARSKPEVPGGGDNPDIFHEAVLEVRKSAEKAEEAQEQAEGWAHGREDLPERAEDNAMYYAGKASEDAKKTARDRAEVERLVESASGIDEQVTKVEELSKNAQEAATQAGTSAEQAELHKQAAETAKESVENLSAQVQKNKESVDKTAQDFTLKAQQALADVNNTGQAQTERVQTAGTTAVENIKTAQDTATQAVETAKTEAVKAVQTEGTTQTGNVTAEGEKQVQAVQAAAQEIIADREQIQKNKTDIADLQQKKADAIVESVSGTLLNVKDSANALFEDFSVYGKSEQVQTTGAQLFDVDAFLSQDLEDIPSFGKGRQTILTLEPNTKYTMSTDAIGNTTSNNPENDRSLYFTTVDDTAFGGKYSSVVKDTPRTITSNHNGQVKVVLFDRNNAIPIVKKEKYIMLNKGETATTYEPYTGGKPSPSPEYPQEIVNAGRLNEDTEKYEIDVKVTGKNIVNIPDISADTPGGTILCRIVDNAVVSAQEKAVASNDVWHIYFYSKDGKKQYFNGTETHKAITATPKNPIIKLEYRNVYITSGAYKGIMVEYGTVATKYEPYKEQTLTLTSDRPLTKWDRLTEQDGQIGWLYNSAEILLNGTENWIRHSEINKETTQAFGLSIPDLIYGEDAAIGQNGLTDKFRYVNAAWAKDEVGQAINNGRLFMNIEKTKASTVEEFKAWLKSNNVKVVYKTKQTEFVPLPQSEQDAIRALQTYYPTTVVSNSEDAEMQLTYVADTKSYTDRKIEEAVSAQTQNLANLLSLMPLSTQAAMIEADTNNILDMEVQK